MRRLLHVPRWRRIISAPQRRHFHPPLLSDEIRASFLRFFEGKNHVIVPSSSVIPPENDASLLFVNSGMIQFKPIFLASSSVSDPLSPSISPLRRVANSQKCIRASGKHNDLDEVGRDCEHHTFFEMLGNWAFNGDYGKRDVCAFAWEYLTGVLGISPDRFYVTYFGGDRTAGLAADEECREIWVQLGVSPDRILPFGMRDNFWEMGASGPCGPCSEIHFDRVAGRDSVAGAALVNAGDASLVEIWNLVFMQYNRDVNGGRLSVLPHRHIDCGMGFERLTAVMQNKHSNYDTDIFRPILTAIEKVSKCEKYRGRVGPDDGHGIDSAYRIVSDHLRAIAVALADGVRPANIDRGYLIRRLIRRAAVAATQRLKTPRDSLHKLASGIVVDQLGHAYPELHNAKMIIANTVAEEEGKFWTLFGRGSLFFKDALAKFPLVNAGQLFSGEAAWWLYSTRGIPLELTQMLAKKSGLDVDVAAFEVEAENARRLSSDSTKAARTSRQPKMGGGENGGDVIG